MKWLRRAFCVGVLASAAALGANVALAAIQSSFDCQPSCTVAPGEFVVFTSTSTSDTELRDYGWDLDGDGLYGRDDDPDEPFGPTETRVRRRFDGAGAFTVGLRVRNARNEESTFTRTVTVATPPAPPPASPPASPPPPPPTVPAQSVTPLTLEVPEVLTLGEPALLAAVAPEGSFVRYAWDLDGSKRFGVGGGASPRLRHAFRRPGTFEVAVRATDTSGAVKEVSKRVVVNRPALANLRWTPYNPKPGEKVKFTLDVVNDTPTSHFSWRFDGLEPLRKPIKLTRRASARAASAQGVSQSMVSSSADLSSTDTFVRTFPKPGVVEVEATVISAGGSASTVYADVGVAERDDDVLNPQGDGITPQDCALHESLPCPQIGVLGEKIVGHPITFDASFPRLVKCFTPKKKLILQQVENLGYPENIPQEVGGGVIGQQARAGQGGCVEIKKEHPKPVQWDFGDGTRVPAGQFKNSPGVDPVILHTYKKAGTYKVSLVSSMVVSVANNGATPNAQSGASKNQTVYIKQTREIEVKAVFCGTLKLNGIPVTTGSGCFIKVSDEQSFFPLYRSPAGDSVHLNNVKVNSSVYAGPDADGNDSFISTVYVSPHFDQISVPASEGHFSSLGMAFDHSSGQLALGIPGAITVPKPTFNAALGRKVTEIPGLTLSQYSKLGGLPVAGGHVFFSADQSALADVNLTLPPVFTGTANAKLGAVAKAANNDETDFSAEFPAVDVGPFSTDGVTINHRKNAPGGWYGGGSLGLFGVELAAPYIEPGNPSPKCAKGGPSGFAISENGKFQFAGASLKLSKAIDLIPPVPGLLGLNCLQVSGNANPFTLQGKVGLRVPADADIINLDACFLIAILDGGQTAAGCDKTYTAKQAETWMRSTGVISLFHTIDLASGYFDLHTGDDLLKVGFGGKFGYDFFDIVSLDVTVNGLIVAQPSFAFELYGKGEICLVLCGKAEVLLSSKGVGACGSIGPAGVGMKYFWGGSVSVFGGCDLSNSGLKVSAAQVGSGSRKVRVPAGLEAISFEAAGLGDAPRITVTDPNGKRYSDDGTVAQRHGAAEILHVAKAKQTIVTVRGKPSAGTWTVESQPGSAPLARVGTRYGRGPTQVRARVSGKGAQRRLAYAITSVPGQTVTFFEEGARVGRQIGVVKGGGTGSLRFPPGYGPAGERAILAVIDQGGIPLRKARVATYTAGKAPVVQAPDLEFETPAGGHIDVDWQPVPGVDHFDVHARVGDGREIKLDTRQTGLRIGLYDDHLPLRVSVVAVAKDGRKSAPTTLARKGGRPPISVVRR